MFCESLAGTHAAREAARAMPPVAANGSPGACAARRRSLFHRGAATSAGGTGISRGVAGGATIVWLALWGRAALAACTAQPLPVLEPVAPQVWRVAAAEGEASPDNGGVVTESVLVVDGDRAWLVGSGPTPSHGKGLACAVETTLGRKVTDLINTRAHPELAMGNTAFATARVWALDDVARAMDRRCRDCLARLAQRIGGAGARLDDSAIRVPDRRLGADGAQQGQLGPFLWWALPRAAGERTLVLRLRERPIVIAQGLVWPGRVPNLRETESTVMLRGLHELRTIAKGATTVLGEQGAVGSVDDIAAHMDYIVALRAAIQARVTSGTDENAGLATLTMPMFAERIGGGEIDTLNRQRIWREIEKSLFR